MIAKHVRRLDDVVVDADEDHVVFVHARLLYRMADSLAVGTGLEIRRVP
jgi:hypothetical protein